MTNFEDVCKNYEDIEKRYKGLKDLLIHKLKKYKVSLTSEETFQELVHKVPEILTNEYDIVGNYEPTDVYVDISTFDIFNISRFNETLFKRTMYYIKWLRFYLAYKGVDLQKLNRAKTLKDHILLIDFVDRIKDTVIEVNLIQNSLYYGKNVFQISIIDDEGEMVTGNYLSIEQDGILSLHDNTDEYIVIINDLEEHTFSFQYNGDKNHKKSNIVSFTLQTQPMPITLTSSLNNTIEREYINQENIIKGYIDDVWSIYTSTYDINGDNIYLPINIKIYDNDPIREDETNSFENYNFKLLKYNSENNNNPIKVSVEPQQNQYYIFNENLIEYYINVWHSYYQVTPTYDYTSKQSYTFVINFYDEISGEPTTYFDNKNSNIIFKNDEDDVLINTSSIINNSNITIQYNNNLLASEYFLDWEIPEFMISNIDIINILPNIRIENDYIYAADGPCIQLLNNPNIRTTMIRIQRIYYNYDTDEISIIEDDDLYYPLEIDENNYIIIPDEYKQIGLYLLRMENYTTQEEYELIYEIAVPYSYYSEKIYDRQEFYIKIYDKEDFDINNITDYIKIFEYTQELEYQWQIDENDNLIIIADVSQNPDFKGINKFWININGYEQTEEFQLLSIEDIITEIDEETGEETEEIIYDEGYEILNEVELGINDMDIACYKWNVNHIDVAITHNGNTTNYSLDSDDEDFLFTHNFESTGDYSIAITDYEETVVFNYTITGNNLKIQDFKFKENIQSNEEPTMLNCLGFGFTGQDKINEDITIVFYCDDPSNILTTKIINAQDSQYHIYTDIKFEDLPEGPHTIYASYSGGEYYNPFVVSKEIYRLGITRIIYDKEYNSIDIGESIELSLLTLDSRNNIVNEGYYIYNNEIYGLHQNITIAPQVVDDHYTVVIYYKGEGEYEDASVTINYIIRGDIYDYYASSRIGDNTNNGVYPTTAVQDIDTLFTISQPEDLLCLMAGEYNKNTINRSANLYGYHKHNYQDIKLTCYNIAPNVTLRLKNVMLDTGNGFTFIDGLYEFVNSSNQTVALSTIPGTYIETPDKIGTYDINIPSVVNITEGQTAVLNGIITKNDIPIEGKLIKVYQGQIVIKAGMSLSDGSFNIILDNNETVTLTLEVTDTKKDVLVRKINEINILLNGNEEIQNIQSPDVIIENNELIGGGTGYIISQWSNLSNWELDFDCYTVDNGGNSVIIVKNGMTVRGQNIIQIQPNGNVYVYWNANGSSKSTSFSIGQTISTDSENPTHFHIVKIDDKTLQFNVNDNDAYTYSNNIIGKFANIDWCIGIDHWNNNRNKMRIKNINIKEPLYESFYTNSNKKFTINNNTLLNSTGNDVPIIKPLFGSIQAETNNHRGYISEGFKNTKFWEINCVGKCSGNDCAITIYNKGVGYYDFDCAIVYKSGRVDTLSKSERNSGEGESCGVISDSEWTPIKIKRISSKTICVKIGDEPETYTIWDNLPIYEELCVGVQSWTYNNISQVREIKVDNIYSEPENILFEDIGVNITDFSQYQVDNGVTLSSDKNYTIATWKSGTQQRILIPCVLDTNKNWEMSWQDFSNNVTCVSVCNTDGEYYQNEIFDINRTNNVRMVYYNPETQSTTEFRSINNYVGLGPGSWIKIKYINKIMKVYVNGYFIYEANYDFDDYIQIAFNVRDRNATLQRWRNLKIIELLEE